MRRFRFVPALTLVGILGCTCGDKDQDGNWDDDGRGTKTRSKRPVKASWSEKDAKRVATKLVVAMLAAPWRKGLESPTFRVTVAGKVGSMADTPGLRSAVEDALKSSNERIVSEDEPPDLYMLVSIVERRMAPASRGQVTKQWVVAVTLRNRDKNEVWTGREMIEKVDTRGALNAALQPAFRSCDEAPKWIGLGRCLQGDYVYVYEKSGGLGRREPSVQAVRKLKAAKEGLDRLAAEVVEVFTCEASVHVLARSRDPRLDRSGLSACEPTALQDRAPPPGLCPAWINKGSWIERGHSYGVGVAQGIRSLVAAEDAATSRARIEAMRPLGLGKTRPPPKVSLVERIRCGGAIYAMVKAPVPSAPIQPNEVLTSTAAGSKNENAQGL